MGKKIEPIPLIGVRGSENKISAVKTIVLGGTAVLAASDIPNTLGVSPIDLVFKQGATAKGTGPGAALQEFVLAARRSFKTGQGKAAAAVVGVSLLFGKQIDRRFKDLPIKFGK